MLLWNTPRALFCESQGSPCCWEPQSELHYFLFGTVTYFYWRCSRNGAESCRGCVLQRAIKPWGMEGRQALFFSLYGCCSKGKGFCYLLAFDILLRKEEDIFFFPSSVFWRKALLSSLLRRGCFISEYGAGAAQRGSGSLDPPVGQAQRWQQRHGLGWYLFASTELFVQTALCLHCLLDMEANENWE